MKYVSKREKYNVFRLSLLVGLPLILLTGLLSITTLRVFAVDNIIEVTTTADEDESPGTGCSLYEAILAASTNTAYGGCDSGSATDRDVISLPPGTYSRVADTGPNAGAPDPHTLTLEDVSLVGSGVANTTIDGYGFTLKGDTATTFESLLLKQSSSYNYPSELVVAGSNKTISNVNIRNGSMVPAYLTFLTESGQTVQDIEISNFNIYADLNTNVPATVIDCSGAGQCSDISFSNSIIQSNYSTGITLGDVVNISMVNTTITTHNPAGTTVTLGDNAIVEDVTVGLGNPTVTVGENSSISTLLVVNGTCGSNTVTIKAGTTIDGLEQRNGGCGNTLNFSGTGNAGTVHNIRHTFSGSGGSSSLDLPAPLIDGYIINGSSNVSINNDYTGSVIKNFDIESNSFSMTGSTGLAIDELSNIDITAAASLSLMLDRDNSIINNVSLSYTGSSGSYPYVSLAGDSVAVDGLTLIKEVDGGGGSQGLLNIISTGSTISNLKMVNSYLDYDAAGDFTLENFTITGPSHLEAVTAEGVTNATVRKGYIVDARGGLALTANPSDTTSALIEDMQFVDLGSLFSTNAGAIITTDIDQVNIRRIAVDRIVQDFGAPINIYGGNTHNIANATIVDSSGGVYAEAGSYSATPMNVNLNNVTVYNNENSTDHDNNVLEASLVGVSENGRTLNLNIKNSAFGGSSLYTPCIATDDADLLTDGLNDPVYLNVSRSYSNDSSCVGMGFTNLVNFGMATTLANNSSVDDVIGYNGESGVVQTLALNNDSLLLLAGDKATCEAVDARGFTRDLTKGCDVGAYQFNLLIAGGGGNTSGGGSTGSSNTGASQTKSNSAEEQGDPSVTVAQESNAQPLTNDNTINTTGSTSNTESESDNQTENTDNTFTVVMIILGSVTGLGIAVWIIKLVLAARL